MIKYAVPTGTIETDNPSIRQAILEYLPRVPTPDELPLVVPELEIEILEWEEETD